MPQINSDEGGAVGKCQPTTIIAINRKTVDFFELSHDLAKCIFEQNIWDWINFKFLGLQNLRNSKKYANIV